MAMVDLIRMFQNSAIVMQGLPFAMVVAGIGLVGEIAYKAAEKINEMRMAEEKLHNSQTQLSTGIQDTFNHLADKLLEAQKRVDELNGNHLAALHKELILIDHTSLEELRHSFDSVAKEAEGFFGQLKAHWYELGIGSEGAQHALEQFKLQYNSLLAQGKTEAAAGLLKGTLEQAEHIRAMQSQLRDSRNTAGDFAGTAMGDAAYARALQAQNDLKKAGVGITDKEVQSQDALVAALRAQVEAAQKIAAIQDAEGKGARLSAHKEDNRDASKRIAEEQRAMREFTANVRQDEDAQIEATQAGSSERLAAIRRAMEETRELFGEQSHIYRHYADEETQTMIETGRQLDEIARQMDAEAARQKQEAAKEAAANDQKMGELRIAAEREALNSTRAQLLMSGNERIQAEMRLENRSFELKRAALQQELSELDKFSKNYEQRKLQLSDRLLQLDQEHANEQQKLQMQASNQELGNLTSEQTRLVSMYSQSFAQMIMGKQSLGRMFENIDSQIAEGMLQNALKSIAADDMTKERDAAASARKAFLAGWGLPFPANVVAAPVMAAGAFAAAMAFEAGTDRVPGIGKGDVVPAMLSPGEGVVPGGVMDGLRTMARNGGFDQKPSITLHVRPTYHVQTIDGDGMRAALDKHSDQLQRHFEGTLRRMNH